LKGVVALTDRSWFEHLRARSRAGGGALDEVNFWRPKSQRESTGLSPGAPFFLRLKAPVNAIAGFGFFAVWHLLPIREAWTLFGDKNGAPDFAAFVRRIAAFRGEPETAEMLPVGCVVLRDVTFFDDRDFLPWGEAMGWSRNIVVEKGYDLATPPGDRLLRLVHERRPSTAPEFADGFSIVECDQRRLIESRSIAREGQAAFRLRLLDAYGKRCAITGERTVPVLDAAHIQPYLGPASNHVQNGIVLRSDLHELFDRGYLTVTPRLTVKVSDRIRAEFQNGRDYYGMHDRELIVRPERPDERPSLDALAWHNERVFR
jgi:putative restriction endonuclease